MNTSAELLKQIRIDRDQAPPPSRRGWLIAILVVGVVVFPVLVAWRLGGTEAAAVVETAQVRAIGGNGGTAQVSVLDASGYVVARRIATVSAKIIGKVEEVLIEEGMHVSEGQVLARLEPIDVDAQLALSRAQLESARSQLASIEAQLTEAEANVERLQALVAQALVARAQFDQAIAARDSLRAQLATAQRNVEVSRNALRITEINKDNTIVRAPFAGVVIAKAAQPGEIISPAAAGGGFTRTGICTIVDMDSLEVEVDVGEAYIARVQPKMPVEAVLNAYPEWKIPAEVIAIIPTADRGKATVKVRIALHAKDARIVPDMGVKVGFLEPLEASTSEAAPAGVRVPASAIVQRDGQSVVFVLGNDGSVIRRVVRSGRALGADREILEAWAIPWYCHRHRIWLTATGSACRVEVERDGRTFILIRRTS